MLEMLLTRLNESDAQRNAQYVEVNAHLAAVNKRIEDIERRSTQTQQQHPQQSGRGQEGRTASRVPPTPLHNNDGCVPQVPRQTHKPYDRAQLPGYVTCGPSYECTGRNIRVCTLVKRGIAFIEHELEVDDESDVDHIFIEILPSRGKRVTGLFVLNVYSTPSKRGLRHTFDALFREAMAKAASAPLLICGDFNAPHTQWGYGADSPKGKKLARLVDDFGLTVLNEPASHTRIGQGACRDTSPDLSIWSGAGAVAWSNSFEDLGSDHRVLCVTVGEEDCEIDVCLKARIVDWEQFRKNRQQDKQEGPIEDIGEWCRGLLADVERVTKEIEWTDWRQEPPKEEDESSAGGGDGVLEPTRIRPLKQGRVTQRSEQMFNRHLFQTVCLAFVMAVFRKHPTD
ncbi:hypothetical protein HPB50_019051 [Hyalomma asiaticum]|uniref:Uncharacterized protein n=1 Tax=Hyalomma asiaticum TaxID=266040 RepID=A0ACB7TK64_HYAAI|nr:hypothetical protein HPB50_019051 [Hyalomma asiaticum]